MRSGSSSRSGGPALLLFWSSDLYSVKSAYIELFQGAVLFGPGERIWRSWASGKCQFFYVAGGSQVTTNVGQLIDLKGEVCHTQLAAPSCDQEPETMNHLLVGCVFAREFWFLLLQRVRLQRLSPQPTIASFDDW